MYTKEILYMFSKTILLVDDTPLFIKLAKDFFRREQVNVLTARNGPEAVAIVKAEKPDLVFMDLYMDGGDGDKACQEIKIDPHLKTTPIIMVTSSNYPVDIERCLKASCNEIIHKPLNREHFLNTSRRYLHFPGWSGKRVRICTPARFWIDPVNKMTGFLSDISVGGVFLETDVTFPIDTVFNLELQLYEEAAFKKCKGRVAWVNRKGSFKKDYATAGMGIEFIDINKLDILSIQAWLRNEPTL
jgi:CheY-like chemotaxis protein